MLGIAHQGSSLPYPGYDTIPATAYVAHHVSHGGMIHSSALLAAIEDRIAAWTLLPVGNGEGLQVLRYINGQKVRRLQRFLTEVHQCRTGQQSLLTELLIGYFQHGPSH